MIAALIHILAAILHLAALFFAISMGAAKDRPQEIFGFTVALMLFAIAFTLQVIA